ncbi:MAG: hypothetical protein JXR63_06555 [Spirochaetales bacterium]|nr:hypothetical protein [Spirochaetales bacterium]
MEIKTVIQGSLNSTKKILKEVPFGIFLTDSNKIIHYLNKYALKISEYTTEDQLLGKPSEDFFTNCDATITDINQPSQNKSSECLFVKKSMQTLPIIKTEIKISIGTEDFYIESFTDISLQKKAEKILIQHKQILEKEIEKRSKELIHKNKILEKEIKKQKETEKNLKEAQSQLIQAEKLSSIGELAAGIAHEINNPLGYIISNTHTLERYLKKVVFFIEEEELKNNEKLQLIIKDILPIIKSNNEGLDQISKIVSSLKDFSRIDSIEKMEFADLNKLIKDTIIVARNRFKYIAKVQTQLKEIPLLYCNPSQINQVILNIIINAAQAIEELQMDEKGIIKIKTWNNCDNIFFSISNNGAYLPKEIQKEIFNPFFTTKDVGKGTGLGLNIAYDIISIKHNGKIKVKSIRGKYTTFTITLPIVKEIKEKKNE